MRSFVLFIFFLCFAWPVFSQNKDDYDVSVPVDNQSEEQRLAAFSSALTIVDQRLSEKMGLVLDFSEPLAHPEQYVESFSYVSSSESSAPFMINIHFDPKSLRSFMPKQEVLTTHTLEVQIINITSWASFNALMQVLRHMSPPITTIFIHEVSRDRVALSLSFQGSSVHLIQQFLKNEHFSSLNDEDNADISSLSFRWNT